MSWQLGSLVLVMLVIGTGLVWYERSRPPSQIVALVAVLAAMEMVRQAALEIHPAHRHHKAIMVERFRDRHTHLLLVAAALARWAVMARYLAPAQQTLP